MNLSKDFSYKDLFYAIYEKKLEENDINRIKLYDFNKLVHVSHKNINPNKSLSIDLENRSMLSLQKNKLIKIITNSFIKDFKTQV